MAVRTEAPHALKGRAWQLVLGLIAMMSISSAQYVWTLFVKPLQTTLGTSLAALQVTFSLFVVLQTGLSPLQGFLIERLGPRPLISAGAALVGASWVLSAYAHHLAQLYLAYGVLGGIGSGVIYVGVVGLMLKWFPDRRGFATGMVAAGYGFGAMLTTFPIASLIKTAGYQHALIVYGVLLGSVGLLAAQGLKRPPATAVPAAATAPGTRDSAPEFRVSEMLRAPAFWLLFLMMTLMSTGGLMVISQMGAFAKDFGVSNTLVFGLAALPLALSLDRFTNGLTRPFFGWVSDRMGREHTMALAFTLEAVAIMMMLLFNHNALAFVLLSGVVFFGWGEIFSLFPSTLTDIFGTADATTKYGFLYVAQGVGSIFGGPMAALLYERTHQWTPIFALIAVMDMATALLALFALKPLRMRLRSRRIGLTTPVAN